MSSPAADGDREGWPWISGRHELIRLVAARHHDALRADDLIAALAGIRSEKAPPSWAEILDASDRALEATGREIAAATNRDAVDAARLRMSAYSDAREEAIAALLRVAHCFLQRTPPDSRLIGYGRPEVGASRKVIRPEEWEAGKPDWENWRLVVAGGTTYHGVRLLHLDEAPEQVIEAVLADLRSGAAQASVRRPGRFSPEALSAWYGRRVKGWPDGKAWPSRDDDIRDAKAVLGDHVPSDAVERVRAKLAPEYWKKPGRPKGGSKTGGRKTGDD